MSDSNKIYYILVTDPYKIESTDSVPELINLLYEQKADFISEYQRKELDLPENYITFLKKLISKYEERVPLYDITFNHIYLIHKDNVYPHIYYDNYRFVTKSFYKDLLKLKNPSEIDKENIRFLAYYDLDILQKTYMKLFYQSFILNKYITSCARPSFHSGMEHISPYYHIDELYYLAYDWNLTYDKSISEEEIERLCKKISKFDIPAKILLDHQIYIYDTKSIGLVKHYSLFGSYYMNLYLRKHKCCIPEAQNIPTDSVIRNMDLENQIILMIKLIKNAPAFNKSHTVYRFIIDDKFLSGVKIGDVYQDISFMSTTRNPFYYSKNYTFGYILMKIKLPANIKGVGLCIESYSNFPEEEEIILPPTTKLKLDKIIENVETTDHQHILNRLVKKKYEFTWIDNNFLHTDTISLYIPNSVIPETSPIDLKDVLSDENFKYVSIADRFKYFKEKFVIKNQFVSIIGDRNYVFNIDAYDSSTVYKPYFYYEVSNGIMITSANPRYGNINILIELGPELHVNYYFKFSVTDSNHLLDLNRKEWIEWLCFLAYAVGSRLVVIHSNYVIHYDKKDTIEKKQMKTRYTFSQNIYQYFVSKKKLFDGFIEITPNFNYTQLDYLFGVPIEEVIRPTDQTELYRIALNSGVKNVADFYIYIVNNYPKLVNPLLEYMDRIFTDQNNPFKNISYNLDIWMYLLNKGFITYIPSEKEFMIKKGQFKQLIGDKKIPKFKNRLRFYLSDNK